MSLKVLVVDDEPSIQRLLKVSLSSHDYAILQAYSGQEALTLAAQWQPAVVLLDLGLPDMDGMIVLARLREWYVNPILILSVRSDEEQIVSGLDGGANDYLTKPFSTSELLARIRASLRTTTPNHEPTQSFEGGHLKVDFSSRQVLVNELEVKFTATEYEVLRFFILYAGRAVTHKQILKAIWGPNATYQNQYIRVYVNHIRQKIESDPARPTLIVTESGVGYRFCGKSNAY